MRRGPAVFLLLLLLIASAYGAQRALADGWHRISGFTPAHHSVPGPATGPPALTQRLVLVVAEGLRPEDAPILPSLDWLQRHGASYRLTVPSPVYPAPAMATLLTGAPPTLHGVLLPNTFRGSFGADTLVAAAARAKLSTAALTSPELAFLLRPTVASWASAGEGEPLPAQIRPLLARGGPRLVIIHLDQLHRAAHQLGTADRDVTDYRTRLAELDGVLTQVLEQVDLKTATVMVAGTVPTARTGEHPAAGTVPLIMAGAGVRQGALGEASLTDVAPTAAALLGTPTPLQARGRPLLDAIQSDGRRTDVVAERWLAARQAYATAMLQAFGSRETAPEPPAVADGAEAYVTALDQQVKAARFDWWKAALIGRLPYLGGGVLLLLLYLAVALRVSFRGPLLLTILLYAALFHGAFFLSGGRYGPAMAGLEHFDGKLLAALGLKAAAAMGLASILTGYHCSRLGYRKGSYLAAVSAHTTLSLLVVLTLPVAVALLFTGWDFPEQLPGAGLLIWFCVTAVQVVVLGYLSPVWALLTVISARTSRRLWPLKEVGDPERNADKVVRMRTLRQSARRQDVKG